MKTSIVLVALLLAASAAAADNRVPTPAQAERNLKAAEREMQQLVARYNATIPPAQRELVAADNAAWRERVKAGCAPADNGGNSGSAAAAEYAVETQCTADATIDRTRRIREAIGK